jgi:hypothetical protein
MRRPLLLAAALVLAACHDGDSGATAFDPFVTNLIQGQTTETGEPVEVEGRTFSFPADDTAFDDVLPPDTGPVVDQ